MSKRWPRASGRSSISTAECGSRPREEAGALSWIPTCGLLLRTQGLRACFAVQAKLRTPTQSACWVCLDLGVSFWSRPPAHEGFHRVPWGRVHSSNSVQCGFSMVGLEARGTYSYCVKRVQLALPSCLPGGLNDSLSGP